MDGGCVDHHKICVACPTVDGGTEEVEGSDRERGTDSKLSTREVPSDIDEMRSGELRNCQGGQDGTVANGSVRSREIGGRHDRVDAAELVKWRWLRLLDCRQEKLRRAIPLSPDKNWSREGETGLRLRVGGTEGRGTTDPSTIKHQGISCIRIFPSSFSRKTH